MIEPTQKNPAEGKVICHAYPLPCSGVSAVRSANRRRACGLPNLGRPAPLRKIPAQPIPPCASAYCYLFEEINPGDEGRER